MKELLTRPIRLPRFRPYVPGPTDPAIFWFNSERGDIIREVASRVVERYAGSQSKLEYALNEAAFLETKRLESQRDDEARRHLGFWRGLARKLGKMDRRNQVEALEAMARHMANDVAGNFDPRVYRLTISLGPTALTGVMQPSAVPMDLVSGRGKVDDLLQVEGELAILRNLSKLGTLVFVPTHSSNMDSVVLGYAMYKAGLPPVVYGAGKNLFTNPFISFFMHNLGAYRVDRRIRAPLYKDVLKTYAAVMIERGYHSLFFPGGTRSRSGMIEQHLKLGLAGAAVEAFSRNQSRGIPRRVFFVPTTINYALVLEAETLVEEWLKEAGKARYIIEDDEFSQWDRWVAFFQKVIGLRAACVLRFGRPLDPFGNDVDDEGRSLTPQGKVIDPLTYIMNDGNPTYDVARDMAYTRELGSKIAERYLSETVIMATQLVAHILFRKLVASTPGLDLFARLRHRGDVSMSRGEMLEELGQARDALRELTAKGEVRMSPVLSTEPPDVLLERVLDVWSGYHVRQAVVLRSNQLFIEDPSLVLYYQNRLVPYATRIASPAYAKAAAEIAQLGVKR